MWWIFRKMLAEIVVALWIMVFIEIMVAHWKCVCSLKMWYLIEIVVALWNCGNSLEMW